MIHGFLRTLCSRNPKNIRNPPYLGYFLMFLRVPKSCFFMQAWKTWPFDPCIITYTSYTMPQGHTQYLFFKKLHKSFAESTVWQPILLTWYNGLSNSVFVSDILYKIPVSMDTLPFKISQCLFPYRDLVIWHAKHCTVTAPPVILRMCCHAGFHRIQMDVSAGL